MNFDYKGYSEAKLIELSNDQTLPYILWESYSFGKLIREYGFYPRLLPINIYHQHGAGRNLEKFPYSHELESNAYCMFVNNQADVKMYNDAGMNCEVMLHPFIYYRRSRKIEKSPDAKGTIVFPSHITLDIDDLSDISLYIKQLRELPEIYKPLSVCLCWVDIIENRHKIWIENGFPVYTVGHAYHENFVERFYELIRHFKFMTSNSIGSQTYYAVEMGITFFLHGPEPKYFNKSDPGVPKGVMDLHQYDNYNKIYSLFTKLTTEISHEQKKLVLDGLGVNNGISRFKMMTILYIGFFRSKRVCASIKNALLYLCKCVYIKNKEKLKHEFIKLFFRQYRKF
jgi:hypothetical protein